MSETVLPGVTRRRALTPRGQTTRERILDATVRCIVRSGYAATTVENVMTEAGTSRGSVLHQFPSRMALAVATVEQALQGVMNDARMRAARVANAFDRLADYGEIVWDTHSSPQGLALADVFQAARWDAELAAAIRPITSRAETEIERELLDLAEAGGIPDPSVMIGRGWMLVASARGLIVENGLGPNRPMILAAIAEMKLSHRRFCEALVPLDHPARSSQR